MLRHGINLMKEMNKMKTKEQQRIEAYKEYFRKREESNQKICDELKVKIQKINDEEEEK